MVKRECSATTQVRESLREWKTDRFPCECQKLFLGESRESGGVSK